MAEALRELLATFRVDVDPERNLPKANAAVDALQAKINAAGKASRDASGRFLPRGARVALPQLQALASGSLDSRIGVVVDATQAARAQGLADRLRVLGEAGAAAGARLRRGLGGALDGLRERFARSQQSATGFGAALAALGVGAAARSLAHLIDEVGGIGEAAAKLGVTTDEFQRLSVFAKQNATDVGALGTAFRNLAKLSFDPTKDSAEAFARLGVATKDANGQLRPTQDLFFDSAEALADVANEGERTALATKLYGRSAIELKPILAGGSAAIRAQREELAKMAVISEENIRRSDALADSFAGTWAGLRAQLINRLFPVLLPLLERFTKWLASPAFDAFARKAWAIVQPVTKLVALAGGVKLLGGAFSSLIKLFTGALWKFPLLLILEDFIYFLLGKRSLIGAAIDKLFGKGAQTQALDAIKSAVEGIANAMGGLIAKTREFLSMFPGWEDPTKPTHAQTMQSAEERRVDFNKRFPQFAERFPEAAAPVEQDWNPLSWLTRPLDRAFDEINVAGGGRGFADRPAQQQTNNLTFNVGSAAEVQQTVTGALRGVNARGAEADAAAAGYGGR